MSAVWSRFNTLLLLLVLLALVALIGMLATDTEGGPLDPPSAPNSTDGVQLPGRPVTGPTYIDEGGSYYLTRNINSGITAPVIIIDASNVVLDLNKFAVRGGEDYINSVGILIQPASPEHTNIEIRNGTVRDFHVGIKAGSGMFVRIKDVHLVSNIRGAELGTRSLMEDCSSVHNSEMGVYMAPGETANSIKNCQVMFNGGAGIRLDGANNLLTESYVRDNQAGLDVSLVGNKNVVRDSYLGEVSITGSTNIVMDNACVTATSNGGAANVISPASDPNFNCFP